MIKRLFNKINTIKHIVREAKRIKKYPDYIIEFMLDEKNWIKVNQETMFFEFSLLSYPEYIYILNLDNANYAVSEFFHQFRNKPASIKAIKQFTDSNEKLDKFQEIEIKRVNEDNPNCYYVFAYIYLDDKEENIVNKECFDDDNHVFIFNGLAEKIDYHYDDFAKNALNVSNYETF